MENYRANSTWNDENELKCLVAFKKLLKETQLNTERENVLSEEIAKESSVSVDSVKMKIGNYKSLLELSKLDNTSSNTRRLFKKHCCDSVEVLEEILKKRNVEKSNK